MLPRRDPGILVQVKPSALEKEGNQHWVTNRDYVSEHGYLWLVDEWAEYDGCYWCNSLATGQRVAWFPVELTEQTYAEA